MNTEYIVQALVTEDTSEASLPAFAEFISQLSPGTQIQSVYRGLNLRMPFEPGLLASAKSWADAVGGLRIREFFVRDFTVAECASAELCRLFFAPCYLEPEPTKFEPCADCSGDIEVTTGRRPTRLVFQHGVGAFDGSLYLSEANAQVLHSSGLTGYTLAKWPNNKRYWQLTPVDTLEEILIEGENAIGVTGDRCSRCQRPSLRYHIGPSAVRKADYGGGDFINIRFMNFLEIAFSQNAARFLISSFRDVRYWEPVWLF